MWGGTFLRVLGRWRWPGQQLSVQPLDLGVLGEHELLETADLYLRGGGGTDDFWNKQQLAQTNPAWILSNTQWRDNERTPSADDTAPA